MKATLFVTQDCNLSCDYCYIQKRSAFMDLKIAERAIDFIAKRISPNEKVDIGFFGGEPLLALPLILSIAKMVRTHSLAQSRDIGFQVVSNGTLINLDILRALASAGIDLGISCDGPPISQDAHRRYRDGRSSSMDVENAIALAVQELPFVMVNAVYRPETIGSLPDAISYFYELGVRNIFLTPDFSAMWSQSDLQIMQKSYATVAALYRSFYLSGDPARISLIDAKIAVIINGGYAIGERCSMGHREFAFGPEGNIFPCERLAGDCLSSMHCIGNLVDGITTPLTCNSVGYQNMQSKSTCSSCSICDFCMHWCGCSNFFATGLYDRPGAFLCASEKEIIRQAICTIEYLSEEIGPNFINDLKDPGRHSYERAHS